jgi:hypothetical protein
MNLKNGLHLAFIILSVCVLGVTVGAQEVSPPVAPTVSTVSTVANVTATLDASAPAAPESSAPTQSSANTTTPASVTNANPPPVSTTNSEVWEDAGKKAFASDTAQSVSNDTLPVAGNLANAAPAAPKLKVKVTSVIGKAEFSKTGEEAWQVLRTGAFLQQDYLVKTGVESTVELAFQDGSKLLVKENSSLNLRELTGDSAKSMRRVKVEYGTTLFNIKTLSPGSAFQFETSVATASVRGTRGGLSMNKGVSGAYLEEGALQVQTQEGVQAMVQPGDCFIRSPSGKVAKVNGDNAAEMFSKMNESILKDESGQVLQAIEQNPEAFMQSVANPVVNAPQAGEGTSGAIKAEPPQATQPPTLAPASPQPPAQAPASTPATPDAPSKDPAQEEEPKEPESSSDESPKAGMTSSVSIGQVSVGDSTMTRVSFRPEFSLGNLGVALDIELFLDSKGNFSKYGWQFDDRRSTMNTLYRKIYYVRWNHPGDKFYIRAGALENITLDAAGLATSGWGNVARYPGEKQLGVHMQLNNLFGGLGLSVEGFTNHVGDFENGGAVVGAKGSITPLGLLGISLLNLDKIKTGVFMVSDLDQLAGLSDSDNDGCPDEIDSRPNAEGCFGASDFLTSSIFDDPDATAQDREADYQAALATAQSKQQAIDERFGEADAFTIIGIDALWPLINTELLGFSLYGEYAIPYSSDDIYEDDWGLVPLGAGLRVWILDAGLQYRMLNGAFQPGHFNGYYEAERAIFDGSDYVTKEQAYWGRDLGYRQGIYGTSSVNLGGYITVGADYSHLWHETAKAERGYIGRVAVGDVILNFIPKVSLADAFYEKNRIGDDGDSFFEKNRYTRFGYRAGLDMGGGMTAIVQKTTVYSKKDNGELQAESNFTMEAVFQF